MEKTRIDEIAENQFLQGDFFLVSQKTQNLKKNGDVYYRFELSDGKKSMKAVMWDNFPADMTPISVATVVKVQGHVSLYQGEKQLTIKRLRSAGDGEPTPEEFLPRVTSNIPDLLDFIHSTISSLQSPYLRQILESFYSDDELREQIVKTPAAKKLHHGALGGLLEHTVAVTRICLFISERYVHINRDILLAGALLHDIGKIAEFSSTTFDYTDEGRLMGHLFMGAHMIVEKSSNLEQENLDEKNELIHAVLAHHGAQEFGSPVVPMTLEAIALHYADNLDAKITSFTTWIEDNPDPDRNNWSRYWRFMERFLYHRPPDSQAETSNLRDPSADESSL